jgi:hypothetical protein
LERPELAREIKQQALFGPATIFETESGTKESITGDHLELRQDLRSLTLDQLGTVSIEMPAEEHHEGSHLPVLVEEFIAQQVEAALSFAGWLLDRVDPTHRLQEVAPVLSLFEGGYLGWKTRAEHRKNPDVVSMGIGTRDDLTVQLHPPTRRREALRSDVKRLAEDLTVLLRRKRDEHHRRIRKMAAKRGRTRGSGREIRQRRQQARQDRAWASCALNRAIGRLFAGNSGSGGRQALGPCEPISDTLGFLNRSCSSATTGRGTIDNQWRRYIALHPSSAGNGTRQMGI